MLYFDIMIDTDDKFIVCELDNDIVFISGFEFNPVALSVFNSARRNNHLCSISTLSEKNTVDNIIADFAKRCRQ